MAHAPKLISETFQPVRPRVRYFMRDKLNKKFFNAMLHRRAYWIQRKSLQNSGHRSGASADRRISQ